MEQQIASTAQTLDFHTMYKQEQARMQVKLDLKVATPMLVYNMLQDMRHVLVVDFRDKASAFDKSHIRKSIHVDAESYQKVIQAAFIQKVGNGHYDGDDLRRVVFVFPPDQASKLEALVKANLASLDESIFKLTGSLAHIHKAY